MAMCIVRGVAQRAQAVDQRNAVVRAKYRAGGYYCPEFAVAWVGAVNC